MEITLRGLESAPGLIVRVTTRGVEVDATHVPTYAALGFGNRGAAEQSQMTGQIPSDGSNDARPQDWATSSQAPCSVS